MADFSVDKSGALALPQGLAGRLREDPLTLVSASGNHLFFSRPQESCPVLLAGVLESGAVPDLLSYFNMFRKTGVLTFALSGGKKSLFFQQGEIVFATSNLVCEDLGEVLFALGKVERPVLDRIRTRVCDAAPLGKLLVECGAVSPKDLWFAARNQVENIVYTLFAEQQGGFSFQLRAIEQEQILRLSMSTQNLILEGLRRQDEQALFMRKIISLDYYPRLTGRTQNDLPALSRQTLMAARSGQLSARELFRRLGVPEFDGIRVLYDLLERRLLCMEGNPVTEISGQKGEILAIYNQLFQRIHGLLREKGEDLLEELTGALKILPQPYSFVLQEVPLLADGSMDGQRIVGNLSGLEEGDQERLLADSLCEVAHIVAMLLRRVLPAEELKPQIAHIHNVTEAVRLLTEKV